MAGGFLKYKQGVKKNWIAVATFFFFCIYYTEYAAHIVN